LLRDRFADQATFRNFDQILNFSSLEQLLSEAIQNFLPRAPRYGLRHSGLCLIAGAITNEFFGWNS